MSILGNHLKHLIGPALVLALVGPTNWIALSGYSSYRPTPSGSADQAQASHLAVQIGPGPDADSRSPASFLTPTTPDQPTDRRVSEAYGKLPLSFEANRGQTDPRVKFFSRGAATISF